MNKDELREKLAAIEHERWSDWQQWMHDRGTVQEAHTPTIPIMPGDVVFERDVIMGWQRQIETPYEGLSLQEQRSDMQQVDRYWSLIVETFAAWIASEGCLSSDTISIDEADDMAIMFRRVWA